MPFKSKAQQGFLESKDSPLSSGQKKEFESATDFKSLPKRVKGRARLAERMKKRVNK